MSLEGTDPGRDRFTLPYGNDLFPADVDQMAYSPDDPHHHQLVFIEEAAKLMGLNAATVYERIRKGHLRSYEVPGRPMMVCKYELFRPAPRTVVKDGPKTEANPTIVKSFQVDCPDCSYYPALEQRWSDGGTSVRCRGCGFRDVSPPRPE